MNIFVTGIAGFIGSALAKELLANNHIEEAWKTLLSFND